MDEVQRTEVNVNDPFDKVNLAPKDKLKQYFIIGAILIAALLVASALLGAYVTQWNIASQYNCVAIIH